MGDKKPGKMLRQVLMRSSNEKQDSYKEDVYWIDNKLAKANKRLRDERGRIWVVTEVYDARPFTDIEKYIDVWKHFADVLDGH